MSEFGVRFLVPALALSAVAPPAGAQRTAPVPPGAATSAIPSGILGVAVDSLHGTPLAGAVVSALPTSRRATTDDQGRFRIDSLSPGPYQLRLTHALIDTLGLDLTSKPIEVPADRYVVVALSTPSARTLRRALCPSADTVETPSLLTGRVRDADTDALAEGAHVSLVFTMTLVTRETGLRQVLRVRRATVKPDGTYVICGLLNDLHGTLQAERGGMTTAEVDLKLDNEIVALRSLSIGSAPAAAPIAPSAPAARDNARGTPPVARGASPPAAAPLPAQPGGLQRGNAKLAGIVLDSMGLPLADVRVAVSGTVASTVSGPKGEFALSDLPSGTNELAVRHLGFEPVAVPVELTVRETRRVTVHMRRAARTLAPVVVETKVDIGLTRVGFLDRKKASSGHFITPDDIARIRPRVVSDLMATIPGFQVANVNGQTVIQPTRQVNGQGGYCVNVFVDRAPWTSLTPGDFDTAFPIGDVAAVEAYAGNSVPVEFTVGGKSCATIVIWTRTKVGAK